MEGSSILIVSIYVDDIIVTGNDEQLFLDFKKIMMQKYEMTNLGLLRYALGIEVYQYEKGIFIYQEH